MNIGEVRPGKDKQKVIDKIKMAKTEENARVRGKID